MSKQLEIPCFDPGRLLRVAFWTLWITSVGLTGYLLIAEIFGLSILGFADAPRYDMSIEAHVVGTIAFSATVLLAIVTAFLWRTSRVFRRFGAAAFFLQLFYISIPRL